MKSLDKTVVLLVLFFLIIAGTISLRVWVEETNYISPDSEYYLRVAQNIVDGKGGVAPGVYPFDENTEEKAFCMWPIGYPVLIAGVTHIVGNVLISSKIINILFIGFIMIVFYRFYKEKAIVLSLVFCFYGVLEVFSYTWSEGVFLVGLILLWQILLLYNKRTISSVKLIFLMSFLLSFLFLMRYAGIVYIPFVLMIGFYYGVVKKQVNEMFTYWKGCLIPSLVVCSYFYYNYVFSGSMTGSERVFPFMETMSEFGIILLQGLANELTIARNYYFLDYEDWLYITLLCLQLFVIAYVYFYIKKLGIKWMWTTDSKMLLVLSFYYLFVIIILRKISPFDPFNYRILAPFSFLFWVAILLQLVQTEVLWRKVKSVIVTFLLLSLIMNLPKEYLIELVGLTI